MTDLEIHIYMKNADTFFPIDEVADELLEQLNELFEDVEPPVKVEINIEVKE